MDLEDETPVVESRSFEPDVEPMMTSMQTEATARSSGTSSSSSSTSVSSSESSESSTSKHSATANKTGKLRIESSRRSHNEVDKMSESYHEIFDTQMPPDKVAARLSSSGLHHSDAEEAVEIEQDDRLAALCADTEAATQYLTSKLVEDSIRWQTEQSGRGLPWPPTGSPFESPVHVRRPHHLPVASSAAAAGSGDPLSDDVQKNLAISERPELLDPMAILEIERHARYLATSVDGMIENLSGILQSISALTVDTLETYRDGVCKTCDEVDTNIKLMYQLMAKVEELNKSMSPAYRLAEQVKEVKRLLDMLESLANTK